MFFKKNTTDECAYFSKNVDNFAVLLKGSSLEKIPKYYKNFDKCFIVSDYNDELKFVDRFLKGKEVVHFTNRSKQSSLSKENYNKLNIRHIQTGQVFRLNHFRLIQTYFHYRKMMLNLKIHPLPEKMLRFQSAFGEEYRLKFPNTGILAIIYTLEIIRPKVLWVFGLDFYSKPYMVEQTQKTGLSLNQQQFKLDRLNLPTFVLNLFKNYPETKIMMASHYTKWPKIQNIKNIKILK